MEDYKQIIEVEYDEALVEEYKNNYIMEEDGTGADEVGEVYGIQTTFNTDTIEELLGEGAVVDEITEND
ncbi:MAG: hypothetical protein MSA56_05725 [Clostridium sp.]|nr:hypothetical protein [Clostridium sp.]